MLNQQMITQQQQTMSSLITRVDSLAKAVNKIQPQSEKERAIDSPPVGRKRKTHELSDCEDITSDSDILMDSSSEEEADVGKERREMTKKGDSMENKDSSAAGTLAEKRHVRSNMELLKAMGNEFDKVEALGPQVDETLASVVNPGIRNKIDRMVAKELCEKFDRPENCAGLVVPKINKELWLTPAMRKTTKEIDRSFQIAQKYLNQGLIPLVTLMNKLLDTDRNEDFQLAQSAFQLCAYAHRDISNLRRQQLRKVIADKYKQLCNDTTPLTDNLLGDDLEKQINTMDEMQKVGKDLSKYKPKNELSNSNKAVVQRNAQGEQYKRPDKFKNRFSNQYKNHYEKQNPFLGKKSRHYHQSAYKKYKKPDDQKQ